MNHLTPEIVSHIVRGVTTITILAMYLVYLLWVKPRLPKSHSTGFFGFLANNFADILFFFALVPKAADQIIAIFKAVA